MHNDLFWYVFNAGYGREEGPFNESEMEEKIAAGDVGRDTLVYHDGMANWEPASKRPELSGQFAAAPEPKQRPALPSKPTYAHELDYEIHGDDMQFVEITLDPDEACIAEAGSFMYMDPGIHMQTIFGDGSGQEGGFMGKLMSAGKRVLTGESLFMTVFDNSTRSRQAVAFAAPHPGKIVAFDLLQHDERIICQKDSFLCATKGITIGIAFQKKLGVGLFGGEGFILQKIEGDGLAFVHAGGTLVARHLERGETLRLDTGCLVAYSSRTNSAAWGPGSGRTGWPGRRGRKPASTDRRPA